MLDGKTVACKNTMLPKEQYCWACRTSFWVVPDKREFRLIFFTFNTFYVCKQLLRYKCDSTLRNSHSHGPKDARTNIQQKSDGPSQAISTLKITFLAHLSTKCSGWAIVTGLCPSSVVVRRPSCVRKLFYLNIFSSETTHWILTKLHRNDPWVVPYQSCSNGSDWLHM